MSRIGLSFLVAFLVAVLAMSWITESISAQEKKPDATAEKATTDKAAENGADKPAEKATDKATQSKTHKLKPELLKIDVELTGVFESSTMAPVAIHPKTWSSFSVVKAVPHGAKVSKGDQLIWLDMNPIEDKLADSKTAFELSKLTQELADLELGLLEKTLPLDLEMADRSKRMSDEDLLYFLKVGRPQQEKSAKYSLKYAQHSLEYVQEELDQLEKMYEADDLTEESEEIVLKRARNDVDRSKYMLESTELRTKRTLEKDIPRSQEVIEDSAKRSELTHARSVVTLPTQITRQQIERAKQKVASQRSVKKFKDLQDDYALMTIRAPIDGYVYYGPCKRGKFSGIESVASQLKQGGKLTGHAVFMTVVALRPLTVRVEVPEKELHRVHSGLSGKAVPAAFPEMELKTVIKEVSAFPIGTAKFDGQLEVEIPEDASAIVPGMSCKVTIVTYEKKDALTVPAAAVFVDESDGKRDLVYLQGPDNKPTKQKVVIGQKTEKKWEILEGLKAGDEILLKKPDAS